MNRSAISNWRSIAYYMQYTSIALVTVTGTGVVAGDSLVLWRRCPMSSFDPICLRWDWD